MNSSIHRQSQDLRRFKSWGEEQIARLLDRNSIPYLYEHPLAVVDQGKVKIWYPDFQLPGYGVLIEYFGRTNDADYGEGMQKKQAIYEGNGPTALLVTRQDLRGDWPDVILHRIDAVLEGRLVEFRGKRKKDAFNHYSPAFAPRAQLQRPAGLQRRKGRLFTPKTSSCLGGARNMRVAYRISSRVLLCSNGGTLAVSVEATRHGRLGAPVA